MDEAHWRERWRINACCICGVSAIPLIWIGSTGSSCSPIFVYRRMVLKVKCALLPRTLDEEKNLILEREESFAALGAKRHFPWHYSWHLASHKKVLERRDAVEGHSKEHSPSAVKRVGPWKASSSWSGQLKAMGMVNTHRYLWWLLNSLIFGKVVLGYVFVMRIYFSAISIVSRCFTSSISHLSPSWC